VKVGLLAAAALLGGCLMPRYIGQAAVGELDLLGRARPIDAVIADPDVPLAVRELLGEIPRIKSFARRKGLTVTRNYNTYTDLGRDYAVYFVGAAERLSFTPRRWCFPIAGCFAGLGWFSEEDAIEFRDQMEREGYDAFARPAAAFSTGGWFPDPLLNSMLPDGDPRTSDEETGFADLANVFLHESTHATVFIPDEIYFNEGLAEYVGDALADELLVETYGPVSLEVAIYRETQSWRDHYVRRELDAYAALKKIYDSSMTVDAKLRAKRRIIDELMVDLGLRRRPNNASLVETRVYLASYDGFAAVRKACGSTERLLAAAKTVRRSDFKSALQEDLTPVLRKMQRRCLSAEKVARGSLL